MKANLVKNHKICLELFFCQFFLYCGWCFNYRAVAQANIPWTVITDIILTSLSFFVIRRIAASANNFIIFFSYVLGSVFGSVAGIYISKYFLGV
jgi:hypothetical protein